MKKLTASLLTVLMSLTLLAPMIQVASMGVSLENNTLSTQEGMLEEVDFSVSILYNGRYYENVLLEGEELTAEMEVDNLSDSEKSLQFILAVYNNRNILIDISVTETMLTAGEKKKMSVSKVVPQGQEGLKARLLIWDNYSSSLPYNCLELSSEKKDFFADTREHAQMLYEGSHACGKIDNANDKDIFDFMPETTGYYIIQTTGHTNTVGVIYDTTDEPYFTHNDDIIDMDGVVTDENFRMYAYLYEGRSYSIGVEPENEDDIGEYELSILYYQPETTVCAGTVTGRLGSIVQLPLAIQGVPDTEVGEIEGMELTLQYDPAKLKIDETNLLFHQEFCQQGTVKRWEEDGKGYLNIIVTKATINEDGTFCTVPIELVSGKAEEVSILLLDARLYAKGGFLIAANLENGSVSISKVNPQANLLSVEDPAFQPLESPFEAILAYARENGYTGVMTASDNEYEEYGDVNEDGKIDVVDMFLSRKPNRYGDLSGDASVDEEYIDLVDWSLLINIAIKDWKIPIHKFVAADLDLSKTVDLNDEKYIMQYIAQDFIEGVKVFPAEDIPGEPCIRDLTLNQKQSGKIDYKENRKLYGSIERENPFLPIFYEMSNMPVYDEDWYQFTPETSGEYAVQTDRQLYTYIYDGTRKFTRNEMGESITKGEGSLQPIPMEAGKTYYIRVRGAQPRASGYPYNITIANVTAQLQFSKSPERNFLYANNPEFITRYDIVDDDRSRGLKLFEQQNVSGDNTFYETHLAWYGIAGDNKTFHPKSDFYMDVDFYNPGDEAVTVSIDNLAYGNDPAILQCYFEGGTHVQITIPPKEHRLLFETLGAPLLNTNPDGTTWARVMTILFDFYVLGQKEVTISTLAAYDQENLYLRSNTYNIIDNLSKEIDDGAIIKDKSERLNEGDLEHKYKGIAEKQSAWIDANVNFYITDTMNGNLPIQLADPFYPGGVWGPCDYWITNLNPVNDQYGGFLYAMPENLHKFTYHFEGGKEWHFDFLHKNTQYFNSGGEASGSVNSSISDATITKLKHDVAAGTNSFHGPPDDESIGMGSWGATYHYTVTVHNAGVETRTVSYQAKYYDNLVLGYQLSGDSHWNLSFKERSTDSETWKAFSVPVASGQTITFEFVTLNGVGNGGLQNSFIIE